MLKIHNITGLAKVAKIVGGFLFIAAPIGFIALNYLPKNSDATNVTTITPSKGLTSGGTEVKITGDFTSSATTPTTLQEMTAEYCETLPIYDKTDPDPASTIPLADARNGQVYDIRRLQDGKCWMIDNLKLKLTDGMVLTPDDTNVVSNTTVSLATGNVTDNFTTSGSLTVDNGSSSNSPNQDAWRQVDPSNTTYCLGGTNDALSGSGVTLNSIGAKTGCGYLYNYYTAVAGSATQTSHATNGNTAQGSICPAGWRLPHAYSGTTDTSTDTTYTAGDFAILNASMQANTLTTPGVTTTSYYANWYPTGSFRGVPSGYWYSGSIYQGSGGGFWSSSVLSATSAQPLDFVSGYVYPGNGDGSRSLGVGVRCVTDSVAYTPPTPTVTFDGIPATVKSHSATEIVVETPAHAAGTVNVVVSNASGDTTLAGGYTYYSQPIINNITPSKGPTSGNTSVTITGDFPESPKPTMQQMTQAYCESMPIYNSITPNPASTVTLKDTRDGQEYDVRRLQDGNCWMIDNLKLELTDGMELRPSDTNVASLTTVNLATGGRSGNFTTQGGLTRNNMLAFGDASDPNLDAWRQVNPGDTAYCQSYVDDGLSGSNITISSAGSKAGCGYLYNWYTAVAGSATQISHATDGNTAQGSICPAGWRLPRTYSGTTDTSTDTTYTYGDFAILNASMSTNSIATIGSTDGGTDYYQNWYPTGSFRGTPSGYWWSSPAGQGNYGYIWSSSVGSDIYAHNLLFYSGQVYASDNEDIRLFGFGVRCVTEGSSAYNPIPGNPLYDTGPAVTFDDAPATDVSVSSNRKTITATTPAHTAGLVDITIDNGSTSTTAYGAYFYYDEMTVTNITLNHGITTGGTSVTISGTNFAVQPATWTQVAAGAEHTLALDAGGNLFAWGGNTYGQIGNGVVGGGDVTTPYQIAGKYTYIAAGQYHSIAIDSDGQLWTWGYNGTGQIGNGTSGVHTGVPQLINGGDIPLGTKFVIAAAGMPHTMALTDGGDIYVWGGNNLGQLGDGAASQVNSPKLMPSSLKFATISTKHNTNLAITTDGDLYAWGSNDSGQLGNGQAATGLMATTPWLVVNGDVTAGMKFRAIAAGGYHSMALDMAGNLYTWGRSGYGALGNGSSTGNVPTPRIVNGGSGSGLSSDARFTDIAAGMNHSLATTPDGQVYIWGYNSNGQLGNGTVGSTSFTPQLLSGGDLPNNTPVADIAAGVYHSIITDHTGQLYDWGQNANGQIGTGTAGGDISSPRQLTSLSLPFTVTLGGADCGGLSVVNITTVTCTTTAHEAGWVDVVVDNGETYGILTNGYQYEPPYINISTLPSSVDLGGGLIHPATSGSYVSASNDVYVKTNHIGYELDISTNSATSNGLDHDSLPGVSIAAVGGSLASPAVLVNNTWGFTLLSPSDSLPVWVAVPKFGSALQIKATSSTAELDPGDQTTVQYGAKVDFSQPGGRYSAVVVFTVVGI